MLCAGLARAAARAACREMGAAAACGEESIARCCAEEARNEYAPLFGVAAAAACLLAVLCLLLQAPPPASLSLSLLNTSPRGEPTFVVLPSLGRCFARGEGGTPRTRGEKEGATHAKQSGVCVCVCLRRRVRRGRRCSYSANRGLPARMRRRPLLAPPSHHLSSLGTPSLKGPGRGPAPPPKDDSPCLSYRPIGADAAGKTTRCSSWVVGREGDDDRPLF